MKYLKVVLDSETEPAKLQEMISLLKGVLQVEIIDEEHPENELKKAFNRSREQLKKGEYETIVSDIFDILISPKQK